MSYQPFQPNPLRIPHTGSTSTPCLVKVRHLWNLCHLCNGLWSCRNFWDLQCTGRFRNHKQAKFFSGGFCQVLQTKWACVKNVHENMLELSECFMAWGDCGKSVANNTLRFKILTPKSFLTPFGTSILLLLGSDFGSPYMSIDDHWYIHGPPSVKCGLGALGC